MGTILYLLDSDFSANAVDTTSPYGVQLTKYTTPAHFGCMFSIGTTNTNINWGIDKRTSAAFNNSRVAVFDVSGYKGKRVLIKGNRSSLTNYTGTGYPSPGVVRSYLAFTANLGGLSLSDLASLDESVNAVYPVALIDPSPIASEDANNNYTWDLVVPNDANYIVMPEDVTLNNSEVFVIL